MRPLRPVTVAFVTGLAAAVSIASAAPTPIVLPPDTSALKPSPHPGYAVASQKCGICHSADYVDYQPPNMTYAQWTAEMKKMKALYGAPIDDREIALLAGYLTTSYGDGQVPAAVEGAAQSPPSIDAAKLLTDNGCLACHANDKTVFGPAYRDVAARYHGDAGATVAVAAHIHDGSVGRWGSAPMPAFSTLTAEQIAALTDYVLKQ